MSEVSRRLVEARKAFDSLSAVWAHANIPKHRKQQFFEACVITKLMYGLSSMWLLQADRSKLDSFYVKCLRCIHRIPHPMVSHVSNQRVLQTASAEQLSVQLLRHQLILYGKLYRRSWDNLVRQVALEPNNCTPWNWNTLRRVGRPRLQWNTSVYALALRLAEGSMNTLRALLSNPDTWKKSVSTFTV